MTRKKKTATPPFLRKAVYYVEKWAPRLRLENYDIEVVEAPKDFEEHAQIICNVPHLCARMLVRDPKNADPESLSTSDLEVTVVHELLHVRFGEVMLELEGKANWANETATEAVAHALVAGDRRVNPRSL